MKTKVILEVKQIKDLSYLKEFGEVLFEDDIMDLVIIETDKGNIPVLKQHPEIIDVQEERKGTLLEVKKTA